MYYEGVKVEISQEVILGFQVRDIGLDQRVSSRGVENCFVGGYVLMEDLLMDLRWIVRKRE